MMTKEAPSYLPHAAPLKLAEPGGKKDPLVVSHSTFRHTICVYPATAEWWASYTLLSDGLRRRRRRRRRSRRSRRRRGVILCTSALLKYAIHSE